MSKLADYCDSVLWGAGCIVLVALLLVWASVAAPIEWLVHAAASAPQTTKG